jgi:hypothetical protein
MHALLWSVMFILWTAFAIAQDHPCKKSGVDLEQTWNPPNSAVTPQLRKFYELERELRKLVEAKRFDSVKSIGEEYLAAAENYKCNWNYGNAIHDAHSALGMRELVLGNVDSAKKHLLAAGKSPGSPQLNSFGPELYLADALLKRGASKDVTEYLRGVGRFWELDYGVVAEWLSEIKRGERPTLSSFEAIRRHVEREKTNRTIDPDAHNDGARGSP